MKKRGWKIPKRDKIRRYKKRDLDLVIIITIALLVIVVFLVLLWTYFKTPEKKLELEADIQDFSISANGRVAYINLAGGSNDKEITEIKFTFLYDGGECDYPTEKGIEDISVSFKRSFWDWFFGRPVFKGTYRYQINVEDTCLDNFRDVKKIIVYFTYKTDDGNTTVTPPLDTTVPPEKDNRPIGSSSSSSGSSGSSGNNNPLVTCTDDCSIEPAYCIGNDSYISYNCSRGEDGCLDLVETTCSKSQICVNGTGCLEIINCTSNENCTYMDKECSYGVCNNGSCKINYNLTKVCRNSSGECDIEESCVEGSAICPFDNFKPEGTACSLGECDGLGVCFNNVTSSVCGDGVCSEGENCSADAVNCTDRMCYEPTCNNGCGEIQVIVRQNDEACLAPKFCAGMGQCVECIVNSDCDIGENCSAGVCVKEAETELTSCSIINTPNSYYFMEQDIFQPLGATCIEIHAENVTLDCKGHSITSLSAVGIAGVYSNGTNTVIQNCNINNLQNGFGIYLTNANDSLILDNTVNNNDFGIYVRESSSVKILNNVANSNKVHGIFLGYTNPNNIIENNTLNNNFGHGVSVHNDAFNTTIRNNKFRENMYAISISDGNAQIFDNEMYNDESYGIYLTSSNNLIKNNKIINSSIGISIAAGLNNTLENNFIASISKGLEFINTINNLIQNNNINNGGFAGINLYNSSSNTFNNNSITESYYGFLSFFNCQNNNLSNNIVCSNNFDFDCEQEQIFTNNKCNTIIGCGGSCIPCPGSVVPTHEVSSCTTLEETNSVYVLIQDIVHSLNQNCISILAENVTLDCQGHSITSTSAISISGIYSNGTNTVIKNCNINGFTNGFGIYLEQANNSYIFNNTLEGGYYGFYSSDTHNTLIEKNIANNNTQHGIRISYSSNNNTLMDNVVSNNLQGVRISYSSNNNTLMDNVVSNNLYGIYISESSNNTLIGNVLTNNSDRGLFLSAGSNENTLISNLVKNNYNGISIGSSYNSLINNTADNNYLTGIYLSWSQYNTLIDNIVNNHNMDSASKGIELSYSSNNILINNILNNNSYGIRVVYEASKNNITGNTFCSNTISDVYCDSNQTFENNKCNTKTGCGGTCKSCSGSGGPINEISSCTTLTKTNSIYVLTQDVVQGLNENCINILAENVTLDCQGHSITSPGTKYIGGIYSNKINTAIKNCDVTGFSNGWGIYLENANNSIISGNIMTNNFFGFDAFDSSNMEIINNNINSNNYGFSLETSSKDNLIQGNNFCSNENSGTETDAYCEETQMFNDNYCDSGEVCGGSCKSCSSLPSLSLFGRIKQFFIELFK